MSITRVERITQRGLWLNVDGHRHYLSFAKHQWFRNAAAEELYNVTRLSPEIVRWPELDVDLHVDDLLEPGGWRPGMPYYDGQVTWSPWAAVLLKSKGKL